MVSYTSANFIATHYATIKHAYSTNADNMYYLNMGRAGKLVQYSLNNQNNPLVITNINSTPPAIAAFVKAQQKLADFGEVKGNHPDVYLRTLPSGLTAAQKYCTATDGVMALDFTNPFPFLMNRKSTGVFLFVQDERVVSDKMHIPFDTFFTNATCLLEPKLPHSYASLAFIKRNFGKEISANF